MNDETVAATVECTSDDFERKVMGWALYAGMWLCLILVCLWLHAEVKAARAEHLLARHETEDLRAEVAAIRDDFEPTDENDWTTPPQTGAGLDMPEASDSVPGGTEVPPGGEL